MYYLSTEQHLSYIYFYPFLYCLEKLAIKVMERVYLVEK